MHIIIINISTVYLTFCIGIHALLLLKVFKELCRDLHLNVCKPTIYTCKQSRLMDKLTDIRLPTLHAKEWATVAITAILAVVSTVYLSFSTQSTKNEQNDENDENDEKSYFQDDDKMLTNWLGARKSFHMIFSEDDIHSRCNSIKEKLQQIEIEVRENSYNSDKNYEESTNTEITSLRNEDTKDNEGKKQNFQYIGTYYYGPESERLSHINKSPTQKTTPKKQQDENIPFHQRVYYGNPMNAAYTPSTTTQLSGEYNSLNVDPDIYVKVEDVSPNAWRMQMTPTPMKLNSQGINKEVDNGINKKYFSDESNSAITPTSYHRRQTGNKKNNDTTIRRNIKFHKDIGINTPHKSLNSISKSTSIDINENIEKSSNYSPSSNNARDTTNETTTKMEYNDSDSCESVKNLNIKSTSKQYKHVLLFSPAKAKPLPQHQKSGGNFIQGQDQEMKQHHYAARQFFSPSSVKDNLITPTSNISNPTINHSKKNVLHRKIVPNVNYDAPTPNRLR